jgi:c-di-GMP-binding flagellar brake protein YcgR
MPPSDKRVSTRYQVEIEMQVTCDGRETTARTLNLSLSGALVHVPTRTPLRVGDKILITFHVPELVPAVMAGAVVRWVGDLDDALVGLQFSTGLRAKETWALARFLERQTPI